MYVDISHHLFIWDFICVLIATSKKAVHRHFPPGTWMATPRSTEEVVTAPAKLCNNKKRIPCRYDHHI